MMYPVEQVMRDSRSVYLMGVEFITVGIVKMPVSSVKVQSISSALLLTKSLESVIFHFLAHI